MSEINARQSQILAKVSVLISFQRLVNNLHVSFFLHLSCFSQCLADGFSFSRTVI